ncbi:MAG TPA: hypothetical protein VFD57_00080 [Clostridia bacterium]|nr:hypothetical protein [Clostridia bacterium]
MQLDFEIIEQVGQGSYPDLIHFANTQAQIFYIKNGLIEGNPTDKIPYGEWEDVSFQGGINVSPDDNMSHFQVDVLPGFGVIGGYKQNAKNQHKLLIYEFAYEMDRYLSNGSIKYTSDSPISSFNLDLENPDIKDPEYPGNIAIGERNTLLSPGAKVTFIFSMGDSEPYEIGTFYIDRSNFTLLSETAKVEGRNLIGKALKDQTLDEDNQFNTNYIHLIIEEILENAQLDRDQYQIEIVSDRYSLKFSPNTDILSVMEEIFKVTGDWKIEEQTDGTIVIGSEDYAGFKSHGIYSFYRDKDIFSRDIVRDDMESYRRVCVYTKDFEMSYYADVDIYQGWNLLENKTLYVEVPEGIRLVELQRYANELKKRIEEVGKIETFTGPFRPYLMVGDGANIIDDKGTEDLGLITEIEHKFGKNGYYTNFTVDSGGQVGRGKISDYINKIGFSHKSSTIGYDE